MYQPETYGMALLFMLGSMICWGSWANTVKLTPRWPFQAFYWDYVLGILLGSLVWGLTLGSLGQTGTTFLTSLRQADASHIGYAVAGGVIFNAANLLLVAAIDIAGLAVAFPLGIGLALIVGVGLNYLISPVGHPLLLLLGVLLVSAAVVVDGFAFRLREQTRASLSSRGIVISVIAGLLMGVFYPFVAHAIRGEGRLGPYSVVFYFGLGVLLCAIPMNYFLMKRPLTNAPPVRMADYWNASAREHGWAIVGGLIWCTGAVLNFVASEAKLVGPATSYAIGQGATMISAAWGVFIWKEFRQAPAQAKRLIPLMFILFLLGLSLIAYAPLLTTHPATR